MLLRDSGDMVRNQPHTGLVDSLRLPMGRRGEPSSLLSMPTLHGACVSVRDVVHLCFPVLLRDLGNMVRGKLQTESPQFFPCTLYTR